MDIPWRNALLVVAAAFLVFLLAKMLPRRSRALTGSAALSTAKERLREAQSDRDRAAALCDAAAAALALPFGATRAAAYFLRAMRADSTWPDAVERASAALVRRPRMLEKLLWRRLAATPWDEAHGAVVRALLSSLAEVTKRARGPAGQAEVMGRVLAGEPLQVL